MSQAIHLYNRGISTVFHIAHKRKIQVTSLGIIRKDVPLQSETSRQFETQMTKDYDEKKK